MTTPYPVEQSPNYGLKFVTNSTPPREVIFDRADIFYLTGRTGDWGSPPYEITLNSSPEGDESIVGGVKYAPSVLSADLVISLEDGSQLDLWNILDELSDVLAPVTGSDDTSNRGYLYFERRSQIGSWDRWRIPVVPQGFSLQKPAGESLDYYVTTVSFKTLSSYWEFAPKSIADVVIKTVAASAWSTTTWTETPGGNGLAVPTWTVTAPSGQTITAITFTNTTRSRSLVLSGFSLSNSTMVVQTGFDAKDVLINGASFRWQYVTPGSDFWWLLPGDNSITVTLSASQQIGLSLSYRKRRGGF